MIEEKLCKTCGRLMPLYKDKEGNYYCPECDVKYD